MSKQLLVSVAIASAALPALADDNVRESLAIETDAEGWVSPGFRLELGGAYGQMHGVGGAPRGYVVGPVVRVGARLDAEWSLLGAFRYQLAGAQLSGLRYAATIEPTWHFNSSFSATFGVGLGGIVEGRTGRLDPEPLANALETSYTFPDARTPVASCKGAGVTGLVRLSWARVLGARTSTGLGFEVFGQSTLCEDDTGRVEPDTAEPIVRRQVWPHVGANLEWVISWR